MKATRLKEMEQYILSKKFATIDELCHEFNIHPNTARADIKELVEKGVAQKRYGGVASVSSNQLVSYDKRQKYNESAKKIIGCTAAEILEEDDVIFVDAGTTTPMLFKSAHELPEHITVITNNLDVISWVIGNKNYPIFVLPGKVNKSLNAVASIETIESLKTYNIKKAFIGTRGISAKGELTSTSGIDAKLKSTAIEISDSVILMADSNKLNQTTLFNFSSLANIDYWVCERISNEVNQLAEEMNVKIMCTI